MRRGQFHRGGYAHDGTPDNGAPDNGADDNGRHHGSCVTSAPMAVAKSTGATSKLPAGAETGLPFGSTNDAGTKISLLPANVKDVDQALVSAAPKVGPFHISPTVGPKGWPSACTLTDLAQLEALIPSVAGLSGKPQGTKAEVLDIGGKSPQDTTCKFNLKISFEAAAQPGDPSWVQVQFEELGAGSDRPGARDSESPSSGVSTVIGKVDAGIVGL